MAIKVLWTKRAEKKFNNIIVYLEKEWNSNIAKDFIQKTFDLIEILKDFPEIGTIENQKKKIRGILIIQQVSLFYRITKNNNIVILNIFDNRQSPNKKKL